MKNITLAALTALALCGCATVETPQPSADVNSDKAAPVNPLPNADTMKEESPAVTASSETDQTQSDQRYAAPDHSGETLLFGAMTKFELVSFVEIIRAANQEAVLEQPGDFTVFAPNSLAFEYAGRPSPADTASVLRDHMIAGRYDVQTLQSQITENGGPITLQTLSGQSMSVYSLDGKIKVSGKNGVLATITQSDMLHSNGVMHQISAVLAR